MLIKSVSKTYEDASIHHIPLFNQWSHLLKFVQCRKLYSYRLLQLYTRHMCLILTDINNASVFASK